MGRNCLTVEALAFCCNPIVLVPGPAVYIAVTVLCTGELDGEP